MDELEKLEEKLQKRTPRPVKQAPLAKIYLTRFGSMRARVVCDITHKWVPLPYSDLTKAAFEIRMEAGRPTDGTVTLAQSMIYYATNNSAVAERRAYELAVLIAPGPDEAWVSCQTLYNWALSE